jgi:hypothetical protein
MRSGCTRLTLRLSTRGSWPTSRFSGRGLRDLRDGSSCSETRPWRLARDKAFTAELTEIAKIKGFLVVSAIFVVEALALKPDPEA